MAQPRSKPRVTGSIRVARTTFMSCYAIFVRYKGSAELILDERLATFRRTMPEAPLDE